MVVRTHELLGCRLSCHRRVKCPTSWTPLKGVLHSLQMHACEEHGYAWGGCGIVLNYSFVMCDVINVNVFSLPPSSLCSILKGEPNTRSLFYQPGKPGFFAIRHGSITPQRKSAYQCIGRWACVAMAHMPWRALTQHTCMHVHIRMYTHIYVLPYTPTHTNALTHVLLQLTAHTFLCLLQTDWSKPTPL